MSNCDQVIRLFSEKKPLFAVEANQVLKDIRSDLSLSGVERVRIFNRYDVSGMSREELDLVENIVFSEPPVDTLYKTDPDLNDACFVLAVESLPGQYDQRADSAAQCVQIMTVGEPPLIRTAKIYAFYGDMDEEAKHKVSRFLINPVESRSASLDMPVSLLEDLDMPEDVSIMEGFREKSDTEMFQLKNDMGLAMSVDDLTFTRDFFIKENRDPSVTEIRVLDTYWSDHCRHTTFLTTLESIEIPEDSVVAKEIKSTYDMYLSERSRYYGDRLSSKPVCLMDMATMATKLLLKDGFLQDLDVSEEINACSIKVDVETAVGTEKYLLMFKNETHNHPTEIEPFGGAATCLGGAIRDPLSGRSYVYQAMRVTGAGDPTVPTEQTLPGKLSQKKIVRTAAAGYSAYGNQIGLATGQVDEIYHPGYVAKRMEIGAVIAAAPEGNVVRERPSAGDIVILLGGRTGRDGIGGATGSSKAHDEKSVLTCGAEVQKGNPPTERKIQRLFKNKKASSMIIRCNDFGAGGVSVAIGELADGLTIDLDAVPKKYEGLDGTELAISESQERMAVVIRAQDKETFLAYAHEENLEAVQVATITEEPRMVMTWKAKTIVDLPRRFIDTNGAPSFARSKVVPVTTDNVYPDSVLPTFDRASFAGSIINTLSTLEACSRKGLIQRFDGSIGAGSVLMPLGGRYQMTPEDGMIAKIPTANFDSRTASVMTYGFDPYLSEWSPYHGAYHAVVESLLKVAALGGNPYNARLSFQEYFERMTSESSWGKPTMALLGAFKAQMDYKTPAIGGKDSMSGTFNDINVPPTLVSFAVTTIPVDRAVSSCLTAPRQKLYAIKLSKDDAMMYKKSNVDRVFKALNQINDRGQLQSASVVRGFGIAAKVAQMLMGNRLGFAFRDNLPMENLFSRSFGTILLSVNDKNAVDKIEMVGGYLLGETNATETITWNGHLVTLADAQKAYESKLEPVFPTKTDEKPYEDKYPKLDNSTKIHKPAVLLNVKPKVFIPVFPGTNTEFDAAYAFERAGADADVLVVKNLSPKDISEALAEMSRRILNSHILMLPGGFSGGDEPEGSAKFMVAALNNPSVSDAVSDLIESRDGLILGICNGFQALVKVGLLPDGIIKSSTPSSPTLTFNKIGRHQSMYVSTRIASNNSPWLSSVEVGDVFSVPISNGEGRFVANDSILQDLFASGQIATQYVDDKGFPSMSTEFNPNASYAAIEGIMSKNGRILGKMGHNERYGDRIGTNIPGNKDQGLFASGVRYFL